MMLAEHSAPVAEGRTISEPPRRRQRRRLSGSDTVILVLLTITSAFFIVPVYIALINSVKPAEQSGARYMWEWPSTLDWSSFDTAINALLPSVVNSLVITVGSTVLIVMIASVNGYVLAKLKFRGADVLLVVVLFGILIPFQVVLTPLVRTLGAVGLYNTLLGLTLVHFLYGLPLATLIFRNFYKAIPDELMQSAQVDGAGRVRTYFSIILPLSVPGILVVSIYQFTNVWNDFLFGLVVLPDRNLQPVTVALKNLSSAVAIDWNVVMAGAILASIPIGIVYLLFGRYFISGLMTGALK